MPEGHLLHRLARDQAELVGSPRAVTSPQGRFAAGAAAVDGRRLDAVEAHGKHLLHHLGDRALHTHLGMQGRWARLDAGRPPRPQARTRLADGRVAWDLYAPATCEVLAPDAVVALLARLGPDPLRPGADPERGWAAMRERAAPVGVLLLDQAVVAGVGNVLRAEALAAAGVHPTTPGADLGRERFERLWAVLTAMMRRAADEGRIVTVDVVGGAPADLPEAEARVVYKQERCRRCGSPVRAFDLDGRTAYACPSCQPAPPAPASAPSGAARATGR